MAQKNYSMLGVDGQIMLKGFAWLCDNPTKNLIIVTGMEEYAGRYNNFAEYFNEQGINVYCLDHYGQGQTAFGIDNLGKTIPGAYDFAIENIHNLVNKIKEENDLPIYILGHSMGSFITQTYLQKYSNDVNKAVIMGSSGPNAKFLYMMGALLTKIKVNKKNWNKPGKFFSKLSFGGYKKHFPESDFAWLSANKDNVHNYMVSPYCGYGSSNGFFREFLNGNSKMYKSKNLKNIRKDLPILVISGEDDPVGQYGKGPKSLFKMYTKLGLNMTEIKLYPGLRHEILNEDIKKDVYNDIKEFVCK